jgi:ATP-binding cassette, subfamily A (ABC1), member 3
LKKGISNPSFTTEQQKSISYGSTSSEKKDIDDRGLYIGSEDADYNQGVAFFFQQLKALVKKRVVNSYRNKSMILSQLIVPVGILFITILVEKYAPAKAVDSPSLKIDISSYKTNYVPYLLPNNSDSFLNDFAAVYSNQFKGEENSNPFNIDDIKSVETCKDDRKSIDDFISCIGSYSFYEYIDKYIVGSTFFANDSAKSLTGHFNNQPYHVPPLSVNLFSNALLKYYSNNTDAKINVINNPLPRDLLQQLTDLQVKDMSGFQIASGVTFGFSFLVASFVVFLIKERVSDAKHLQYMSGANSNTFWIAAFIWDMVNFLIPSILCVLLLVVSGHIFGYNFIIQFYLLK